VCFGVNADSSSDHPTEQKFDFEVTWNRDVLYKTNVDDSKVASETSTTTLLCGNKGWPATLPNTVSYAESSAFDDGYHVGYSMDNVVIYNALADDNNGNVTDGLLANISSMD